MASTESRERNVESSKSIAEKILEGRCHACSSDLIITQIQGVEAFLEEYVSLNVDAKILVWEDRLLDGSDGAVTYRCEGCGAIYTVLHRLGSNQEELTYHRGSGKERYYEHWVLLDQTVKERE